MKLSALHRPRILSLALGVALASLVGSAAAAAAPERAVVTTDVPSAASPRFASRFDGDGALVALLTDANGYHAITELQLASGALVGRAETIDGRSVVYTLAGSTAGDDDEAVARLLATTPDGASLAEAMPRLSTARTELEARLVPVATPPLPGPLVAEP
jgi:hypothetical protein